MYYCILVKINKCTIVLLYTGGYEMKQQHELLEELQYYEKIEKELKVLQRKLDRGYIDKDEFGEAVYHIIETYF